MVNHIYMKYELKKLFCLLLWIFTQILFGFFYFNSRWRFKNPPNDSRYVFYCNVLLYYVMYLIILKNLAFGLWECNFSCKHFSRCILWVKSGEGWPVKPTNICWGYSSTCLKLFMSVFFLIWSFVCGYRSLFLWVFLSGYIPQGNHFRDLWEAIRIWEIEYSRFYQGIYILFKWYLP